MDLRPVGTRIKAVRKARHLTQEMLAEMTGSSASHIGVIERGIKSPNLDLFVLIANALDVSADSLLQDVVNRSSESTVSELSRLLDHQPTEVKRKIFRAVRAVLED